MDRDRGGAGDGYSLHAMPVSRPATSSPRPHGNRHLLPEDLDAMLTTAVQEASDMSDADADQLTDKLRGLVRPAWLLSPAADRDPGEPGDIGSSRIGGLPDLPQTWQWPTARLKPCPGDTPGPTEAALAFTAQINLAEVPGAADAGWLASSGWLWFFRNENWSIETEPDHVVLHADVPLHELRTTHPPADLDYLSDGDTGFAPDRPLPMSLHRTLFLTANYKADWQSQGYRVLAEALDEQLDEDCAGFELFADIQDLLNRAAVGDRPREAMLLGRPTPCPPPGGACPCGRSAPSDVPGYSDEDGPCSWASDSLLALYARWGDGPLVFTADATVIPAVDGGRWAKTQAWVY
ncbi:DUF1963 domain-containing protein [Micromonospora sp. NPDC049460]|uniref:DUF1963 domain-containing protein n=1 Tax=Micromonospora sp. NPDC049460 TaxID=3364272 RepID=UPI00378F556F